MADCCSQIAAQLSALQAEVAALKNVDENAIIQKAVKLSEQSIIPQIGTIAQGIVAAALTTVYSRIKGVEALANSADGKARDALERAFALKSDVDEAKLVANSAKQTGVEALGKAGEALLRIGQIAAQILTVLALAATIHFLGERMDAIEREVNSLSSDLSRYLGLLTGVKQIANNAYSKAQQADEDAFNALTSADKANQKANVLATYIVDLGRRESTTEARLNNDENTIAAINRSVTAINQNVTNVERNVETVRGDVQYAINLANSAKSSADKASTTAQNANNTANDAANDASKASTTANDAYITAKTAASQSAKAIDAASKAQNTANVATTNANNAISQSNTAINKANTANDAANDAKNTANSANTKALNALGASALALQGVQTVANNIVSVKDIADAAKKEADAAFDAAIKSNGANTKYLQQLKQQYDDFNRIALLNSQAEKGDIKAAETLWNQNLQKQQNIFNQQIQNVNNSNSSAQQTITLQNNAIANRISNLETSLKKLNTAPDISNEVQKELAPIKQQQQQLQNIIGENYTGLRQSIAPAVRSEVQKELAPVQQQISNINNKDKQQDNAIFQLSNPDIYAKLPANILALPQQYQQNQVDINKLKIQQQQQQKMDKDANDKLDKMLPFMSGIPLIPGKVADTLKPSLPTQQQLENAAATGVCRTSQPGGCMNKALNDLGNNVNANTNNASSDLLNKFNAGANAVQLGLLNTINGKLGVQLPGGIAGFLSNFFESFNKLSKWLHLDRLLNIMTFIMTLQNAYFLCSSMKVVTLQMISDGLAVIGISDKDGNPLQLNQIIDKSIESIFKSILGVETFDTFKKEWKALNHIFQAAANLLFAIQNMVFSVLQALEIIGSWNASIGNALKKYLVVGQNAFSWMNPNPNFHNNFFKFLGNGLNVVTSLDFVFQSILQGRRSIDDFGKQTDELSKNIKEVADGFKPPEHKATADAATKSATDSKSPTPSIEDILSLQD